MWNKQQFAVAVLLLIACGAGICGCGGASGSGGQTPPPQKNPVPAITTLSPANAVLGGASFTLTVQGSNFISGSGVQWGGSSRTTTFVSSTQVTAQITADDLGDVATVPVTVVNPTPGGGTSNSLNFAIQANCPSLLITGSPLPAYLWADCLSH